jgi:hypothetical protein
MSKRRKFKIKTGVKIMASHATETQLTRFHKDAVFLKAQASLYDILIRPYEHGEFPESFLNELARSQLFLEEPIKYVQAVTEFNPEAPIQLTSVIPFPSPVGPIQWHRTPLTQPMFDVFMKNMGAYEKLKVFTDKEAEEAERSACLSQWR